MHSVQPLNYDIPKTTRFVGATSFFPPSSPVFAGGDKWRNGRTAELDWV